MMIFLQAIDILVWKVVESPYIPPTTDFEFWTNDAKRKANLNAKAMNALYCAIDQAEFNRISVCSTAHDIWHSLEIIHEGTNKFKEAKISSLVRKYELFKMKKEENITQMFTRFTDIINGLTALGEEYSQATKVKKILRSLTSDWERKTTAIEEAQDLSKLTLDDLMGNLLAYEVHMQERRDEEAPPKKTIAFSSMSEIDADEDDDMALFVRKFNRFMSRRRIQNKGFTKPDAKEDVICYHCNKPGHMKFDCPLLNKKTFSSDKNKQRRFNNKKALHVTWDDSETSSDEDEDCNEVSNVCFMTSEDKVCSISELSREELEDNLQEIYDSSLKLHAKYLTLKNENKSLKSEISVYKQKNLTLSRDLDVIKMEDIDLHSKNKKLLDEISCSNDRTKCMLVEINDLKDKTNDLMKTILKFTNGKKNLDMLLASQRISFFKTGLGYDISSKPPTKRKSSVFVKGFHEHPHTTTRSHAFHDHAYNASSKSNIKYSAIVQSFMGKPKSKWIWVPKSNQNGPKPPWVPKDSLI